MSTPLSNAEVERIAALAHLDVSDAEKALFGQQLADVLAYAQQLLEIDTTGVPATAQVSGTSGHERTDEPTTSLSTEDILANAPDAAPDAGLFRVPRVIGG